MRRDKTVLSRLDPVSMIVVLSASAVWTSHNCQHATYNFLCCMTFTDKADRQTDRTNCRDSDRFVVMVSWQKSTGARHECASLGDAATIRLFSRSTINKITESFYVSYDGAYRSTTIKYLDYWLKSITINNVSWDSLPDQSYVEWQVYYVFCSL